MTHHRISIILFGGLFLGVACGRLGAVSVDGAYNPVPRHTAAPRALSSSALVLPQPDLEIELPPVSQGEWEIMRRQRSESKAHMIGFGRPLPTPHSGNVLSGMRWSEHGDGSKSALVSIRSPGAAALRAELDISHIPPGLRFRYFALSAQSPSAKSISYDVGVAGPTVRPAGGAKSGGGRRVWTPVTVGDSLGIEISVPANIDPKGLILPVPRVSHITESPLPPSDARDSRDLGSSSACQIDVACRSVPPWNSVKDAVAKITFVDNGSSFLCTATLLTDQEEGSWIPYLLTANHCVNTPASAASVNSFWFFQRRSCGGAVDPGVQLSAGAWLLAADEFSDFSLLQLAEAAPGGALFAGWNTDSSVSQSITGIHHPSGDVKKIAFGSIAGVSNCRGPGNCGFNDLIAIWSEGHTESGSSGSGIFNSSGQLLGTLWGGTSFCSTRNQVFGDDSYGRFSDTLPRVERFLALGATPLAAGASVPGQVQEEGWRDYRLDIGASIFSVEVILHQLGTDADLYVRNASKPTLDNFQCAPRQQGRLAEFCTLWVVPGDVVYISVFGSSDTDYHLTVNGSWIGKDLAYAGAVRTSAMLPQPSSAGERDRDSSGPL